MAKISRMLLAVIALQSTILAEDLCSTTPYSYSLAKTTYPNLKTALETLEQYSITAWYTDRQSEAASTALLANITSKCSEDTRMTIVVYGLPNKDCNAGLSSDGTVQNSKDYEKFLSKLTSAIGSRKVLYIVEPDAVGLLADNGCGKAAGYLENLKIAVTALSANPNAVLYMDIGYWLLADPSKTTEVAKIVKELCTSSNLKGVAINTSNYRSNDECTTYCNNFQTAMGSTTMSCIVDTSRNYNGSPTTDWCNIKSAGIGKPPTSETGFSNIDYYLWVKPPGESDGICSGVTQSNVSLTGVNAGSFYDEGFRLLWDQGYFVKEQGMPMISDGSTVETIGKTGLETLDNSVEQDVGQDSDSTTTEAGTVTPVDIESLGIPTTPSIPTTNTTTAIETPNVTPSTIPLINSSCKTKTSLRQL
ncbi:hypothetical protein F444_00158 [Plasmopara halstedii]|uniref:Glycoside hydrolase n=1 Tax=Plasmopara halstedii TaxID=4781 RepID=A0A0P1AZY1_PLAHL|nr:hypothetical protein F444_00158 [Plasmopara halstedii]CEG46934.1 hypothetical protein F444_00158 [Plasmopara halstedii]|eukprot:XP_024583303.1 hypothetical protein F444_00158 [Plasmopara halstedii]